MGKPGPSGSSLSEYIGQRGEPGELKPVCSNACNSFCLPSLDPSSDAKASADIRPRRPGLSAEAEGIAGIGTNGFPVRHVGAIGRVGGIAAAGSLTL